MMLSEADFRELMRSSFKAGFLDALSFVGKLPPISENEAFKRYGKAMVLKWLKDGVISWKRKGKESNSPKMYSVTELEQARQNDFIYKNIIAL